MCKSVNQNVHDSDNGHMRLCTRQKRLCKNKTHVYKNYDKGIMKQIVPRVLTSYPQPSVWKNQCVPRLLGALVTAALEYVDIESRKTS